MAIQGTSGDQFVPFIEQLRKLMARQEALRPEPVITPNREGGFLGTGLPNPKMIPDEITQGTIPVIGGGQLEGANIIQGRK